MRNPCALTRLASLIAVFVLSFPFLHGCTTTPGRSDRGWVNPAYQEMIREWQIRIEKEGWSDSGVHSILSRLRGISEYRAEINDHWDTPKEFMTKGFSGDCEDLVVFMMGTLKRLGYPRGIRVLVTRTLFEDHALLKVEMDNGIWTVYDVVPRDVPRVREALLDRIVEFDEKKVRWASRDETTRGVAGPSNPGGAVNSPDALPAAEGSGPPEK